METQTDPAEWLQTLYKDYRKKSGLLEKPTRVFMSRETFAQIWEKCLSRLTAVEIENAPKEQIELLGLRVCFTNDYTLGTFEIV